MAGSRNLVILVGNLGSDPEIRRMGSGDAVASFRIATSDSWRDKNTGERKERTEWINVVVFNEHIVKVVEQYVKKGAKLYIEGSLQTRKWQDQQGNGRYTTEVVLQKYRGELQMLDSRNDNGGNSNNVNQPSQGQRQQSQGNSYQDQSGGYNNRDLDSEVPF